MISRHIMSCLRTDGIGERQNSKCRRYGFLPYHSANYIIARLLSWYGRKPYLLRSVRISFFVAYAYIP